MQTITENKTKNIKLHPIWRAAIEVAFVVFLFYSNLLMGEFTRSGLGFQNGLFWALGNIFTKTNFVIAMVAALIGYVVFEHLREML